MKCFPRAMLTWGLLLAGCIGLAIPRMEQVHAAAETQGQVALPLKAPVKPLIQIAITAGNPTTQPTALTQDNRVKQHAELLKQTRRVEGKVDLLFFGDAQMQCWCVGPNNDVWKKNYASLNVLNLGMASSQIEHSLWRVNDGALEGLTPKVIVIHSGMHNIWTSKCTPRELVEGVANLVNAVHERIPQARILLIGITPSGAPDSATRTTPREANKELSKFDNGDTLRFLDITDVLIPNNGPIPPGVFDEKHPFLLVKKGYELWAEAMNPLLSKMLGTPVPPATQPTGGDK